MPPLKGLKRLPDVESSASNFGATAVQLKPDTSGEKHFSKCYAPRILLNLRELRRNSRFCDIDITVNGKVIKAHRAILAASSPYFHAMFTGGLSEQNKQSVEIHSVSYVILDLIIDFIYSGEIVITQQNVQDLIIAADMLQLSDIVTGCTEYLKRELHQSNAVGIYRFAEAHNCPDLRKTAIDFIECHFPKISKEEEFYDLPKELLTNFLTSEYLRVDSEYQVFEAAINWICYDVINRKRYVFEILRLVRLPLLSHGLLSQVVSDLRDNSLKVALRSILKDLILKKGSLVPILSVPRIRAKKDIYLIGGSKREMTTGWKRTSESIFESVERFDTFRKEWCKVSPMGIGRILPGVASLNGKIFVVGGEQESQILADGEMYDPKEDKWEPMAAMVIPRCEFGLAALDTNLFAIGGWVGEDIGGTIEKYDLKQNIWHLCGELPAPRFSMGVVAYDGLIYIVGGCSHQRRHLQDVQSYNPITNEWAQLPPMSVPRSQMGCAVLNGYLYIVGGMNTQYEALQSVERYSFEENKWSSVPPMGVVRASPAVAAVDNMLYVIGGDQIRDIDFYRGQITITSVECFDPIQMCWNECVPLPESRSEAGAVVV